MNHLKNEASPYLKMHARNPIDWFPWGTETLEKSKKENKLLVISIGYAACHWCHVMEKESFRDPHVAEIMNRHFISIKVDREERPDIDQIYLEAAQIVAGTAGWPLNVIAQPDGRPVFAGTYFPRAAWISILEQIQALHSENPEKLNRHAEAITRGLHASNIINLKEENSDFSRKDLELIFENVASHMDPEFGGFRGEPKFPLPVVHDLLLRTHYITGHPNARQAVEKTLDAMALGGIYDQIGGGFSRYATDRFWRVPHFEKMLYDNAQLVSLYSSAFQLTRKTLNGDVIRETLDFVGRELTSPEFPGGGTGIYSSLDADSDGEEGQFYTWSSREFNEVLGKDAPLISEYFHIRTEGNLKRDRNILYRSQSDRSFSREKGLEWDEWRQILVRGKSRLMEARSRRPRPALDDKIITAWNSLMIIGYWDAHRALDQEDYLNEALNIDRFITTRMVSKNGQLKRIFSEKPTETDAFLDDYAFTIKAFIALYQATFDQAWLFQALKLLDHVMNNFYHRESGLFFFSSANNPPLIDRKMEIPDQAVPSSNSTMALNLFHLGHYFQNESMLEKSDRMLARVKRSLMERSAAHANWGILLAYHAEKPVELAIVGKKWLEQRKKLDRHYLPQLLLMGGTDEEKLPLLQNKTMPGKTTLYVCRDRTCHQPVFSLEAALAQIKSQKNQEPGKKKRNT